VRFLLSVSAKSDLKNSLFYRGPEEGQVARAKVLTEDLLLVVRSEHAKMAALVQQQQMELHQMQTQYAAYSAMAVGFSPSLLGSLLCSLVFVFHSRLSLKQLNGALSMKLMTFGELTLVFRAMAVPHLLLPRVLPHLLLPVKILLHLPMARKVIHSLLANPVNPHQTLQVRTRMLRTGKLMPLLLYTQNLVISVF